MNIRFQVYLKENIMQDQRILMASLVGILI